MDMSLEVFFSEYAEAQRRLAFSLIASQPGIGYPKLIPYCCPVFWPGFFLPTILSIADLGFYF